MFTSQSNQLNTALQQSGMPPSAADAIVSAIANCASTLTHRGPVKFEYVPQQSRLIKPEEFKLSTQPLGNFEISDGERRPFRPSPQVDPPDEVDDPARPVPDSPPEAFDPTELWNAINALQARVSSVAAEVRANRQVIMANQAAIRYILSELQNTTECPDEGGGNGLIPQGSLGPGIGGLGRSKSTGRLVGTV